MQRRSVSTLISAACILSIGLSWQSAGADIVRWDTGAVLPKTTGLTLVPNANLSNGGKGLDLRYGNLIGNLSGAILTKDNLQYAEFGNGMVAGTITNADFTGTNILWTNFSGVVGFSVGQLTSTKSYASKNLTGVVFDNLNLTGFNFTSQNLTSASFVSSTLPNATNSFLGATITKADFSETALTSTQLASTKSYISKNLTGVAFDGDTLTGFNFSNQNLTGASFASSILPTGTASFAGTTISSANFADTGLTAAQLANTKSYISKNLTGVVLDGDNLSTFDFSNQNLTGASFMESMLNHAGSVAILTNATIINADFSHSDLSEGQLDATKSFISKKLTGVNLSIVNVSGWHFNNRDLTKASFMGSNVSGAFFDGATIVGTNFENATGLTSGQIMLTASYKKLNMSGINLAGDSLGAMNLTKQNLSASVLSGTNLSGGTLTSANLTKASLDNANLTNAKLMSAKLSSANLSGADLTGADLTNATIDHANFEGAIVTLAQLQTTKSYTSHALTGIGLANKKLNGGNFAKENLTQANFKGANLQGADFTSATLSKADFTAADMRGVKGSPKLSAAITTNTILSNGHINGLKASSVPLVIQNGTPITVDTSAVLSANSTLEFDVTASATWTSTMGFATGVTPTLGGNLSVLAAGAREDFVGKSFQLFSWPTGSAADQGSAAALSGGNVFASITTDPRLIWDLSQLYTTGSVTVTGLGVPEPASLMLMAPVVMLLASRRKKS